MVGIIGKLCKTQSERDMVARAKKKSYVEMTIGHNLLSGYVNDGWEKSKQLKKKVKIVKQKALDIQFEDRVWMLFYKLGFTHINVDRQCELTHDKVSQQVDVIAWDGENVFVIECRHSQKDGPVEAKEAITNFAANNEKFEKAIKNTWGRDCGKINYIVAISSQDKKPQEVEYLKSFVNKNISIWSNKELSYLESLVFHVGNIARFQLYSVIYANKKANNLKLEVPAIKGKIGNQIFYSFAIRAKELIKFAYVHHRDLEGITEASQVYQRMLKRKKLIEISSYIDNELGYFPNNIIVNFTKPVKWETNGPHVDTAAGNLFFPQFYGSAWIIDGQHRLYGAARAKRDLIVPVVAFEGISVFEQASLFVQINEKQTSVEPQLMWDLYSDIYVDAKEHRQKICFQIAETAKILTASGPLKGYIDIPSIPATEKTKLKLTTVCTTIQHYLPWQHIVHPRDDSKTPNNIANLINSYYEVVRELWKEDWDKGSTGCVLTNNGFGVLMMVYQDIINYLAYRGKKALLQSGKSDELKTLLSTTYLKYVIDYLKSDENIQKAVRKNSARGPQNENAKILDLAIQCNLQDFRPSRLDDKINDISVVSVRAEPVSEAESKAADCELVLRQFVYYKLAENYDPDKLWKQAIPDGPKRDAETKWKSEISRKPYLRSDPNVLERKFDPLGLGELVQVVMYKLNWDGIFEPVFANPQNFERRIKDIIALRNPVDHKRKKDDQDVFDAISGLMWLARCIGAPELDPIGQEVG